MKKRNVIKEIFEAAGWKYEKDGHDKWHRMLDKLLETGLLKFGICTKGKVWTRKANNFRYNMWVEVVPLKHVWRRYDPRANNTSGLDAYNILQLCASVLKDERVKAIIPSYVHWDSTCGRCDGVGYIPQFKHYCEGICFECYGTGHSPKYMPTVEITPKVEADPVENVPENLDYTKIVPIVPES